MQNSLWSRQEAHLSNDDICEPTAIEFVDQKLALFSKAEV